MAQQMFGLHFQDCQQEASVFTLQTHAGSRASCCHILWAVPKNRGPHCEGRQRRLSTTQGKAGHREGREAGAGTPPGFPEHSAYKSSQVWAGEGGPGMRRHVFILLLCTPQRKHGHHPKDACLAAGNVRKNPDENDKITQTQRLYSCRSKLSLSS